MQELNRLILIQILNKRNKRSQKIGLYRCSCGNEKEYIVSNVNSNNTKSCGCLKRELTIKRNIANSTHGMYYTLAHKSWVSAKSRCRNINDISYHRYGGRGIKFSDKWDNFEDFYKDMGDRPSKKHSLDRIDNNGNYEPGNCKWSTQKEQSRNKNTNRILELNGIKMSLIEWSEKTGITLNSLGHRLNRLNWSIEKALTTPTRKMTYGK